MTLKHGLHGLWSRKHDSLRFVKEGAFFALLGLSVPFCNPNAQALAQIFKSFCLTIDEGFKWGNIQDTDTGKKFIDELWVR